MIADRHYSRQSKGSSQFMPPGRTMILRDNFAKIVFGWLWQEKRDDGQRGVNCSIFRNESARNASEIILEAETMVTADWGAQRLFTYIDPAKTKPIFRHGRRIAGFCFRKSGWKPLIHKNGKPCVSRNGLLLLVKLRNHGKSAKSPLPKEVRADA